MPNFKECGKNFAQSNPPTQTVKFSSFLGFLTPFKLKSFRHLGLFVVKSSKCYLNLDTTGKRASHFFHSRLNLFFCKNIMC
jgi:hypothetical protein